MEPNKPNPEETKKETGENVDAEALDAGNFYKFHR